MRWVSKVVIPSTMLLLAVGLTGCFILAALVRDHDTAWGCSKRGDTALHTAITACTGCRGRLARHCTNPPTDIYRTLSSRIADPAATQASVAT